MKWFVLRWQQLVGGYSSERKNLESIQTVLDINNKNDQKIEDVIVIPAQFDDVGHFSEGLAQFKTFKKKIGIHDKYRFTHQTGEVTKVELNNKRGFINQKGEVVIPAQPDKFEYSSSFNEGLAIFYIWEGEKGKQYGFINQKEEVVIPAQFDDVECFSEGLARFGVGDWRSAKRKYGFIRNPLNT